MGKGMVHRISILEWVSGFNLVIDVTLILILAWYLVTCRFQRGTPHYCLATGIMIFSVGQLIRTSMTWYQLFIHPDLQTMHDVAVVFPIVGNPYWLVGSIIVALGLIKLCYEFGRSFLGENVWILALSAATVLPLISVFFN